LQESSPDRHGSEAWRQARRTGGSKTEPLEIAPGTPLDIRIWQWYDGDIPKGGHSTRLALRENLEGSGVSVSQTALSRAHSRLRLGQHFYKLAQEIEREEANTFRERFRRVPKMERAKRLWSLESGN